MSDGTTITLELRLKPEVVDVFPQHAARILESPAEFPGFRSLRIVRHQDDPSRILFIEQWDSEEDYRAYLAERMKSGQPSQLAQAVTSLETNLWSTVIGEVSR